MHTKGPDFHDQGLFSFCGPAFFFRPADAIRYGGTRVILICDVSGFCWMANPRHLEVSYDEGGNEGVSTGWFMKSIMWTRALSMVLLAGSLSAAPPPTTAPVVTSAGLNAPPPEILPDGSVLHGPFGYPNLTPPPALASVHAAPAATPVVIPVYPSTVETYYSTPYPFGAYGTGSSLVYPYNPYLRPGQPIRGGRMNPGIITNVVPTNGAAALPPITPAYPLGVPAGNVPRTPTGR